MPGLWVASLLFFGVNVWILGVICDDVGHGGVVFGKSGLVKEAMMDEVRSNGGKGKEVKNKKKKSGASLLDIDLCR